jgi:hypothetical protein
MGRDVREGAAANVPLGTKIAPQSLLELARLSIRRNTYSGHPALPRTSGPEVDVVPGSTGWGQIRY